MTGKIVNSMKALAPEVAAAGSELHHLILGPGAELGAEWVAAGLELPHLVGMREYRLARLRQQLDLMGYDGAILWDPMNLRYATDTTKNTRIPGQAGPGIVRFLPRGHGSAIHWRRSALGSAVAPFRRCACTCRRTLPQDAEGDSVAVSSTGFARKRVRSR